MKNVLLMLSVFKFEILGNFIKVDYSHNNVKKYLQNMAHIVLEFINLKKTLSNL